MLTKQDLNSIKGILNEELVPVKKDIKGIQKDMAVVKKDVKGLQTDMTVVKKDVKKLRKDLTSTIEFFDKRGISLVNKLNKTRTEVGLTQLDFA